MSESVIVTGTPRIAMQIMFQAAVRQTCYFGTRSRLMQMILMPMELWPRHQLN
jgi:hypothetical protein